MRKTYFFTIFSLLGLVLAHGQSDKVETVTITQPDPLAIEHQNATNPKAYGFTDGSIEVRVSGGTSANGTYSYEWRNSSGTLLTTTSTQTVGSYYHITLNNIGAGSYTLTVTDDNFVSSAASGGCSATYSRTLTEPTQLVLTLEKTNDISCNSGNSFGDPSSDGELTATASGGVPFDFGEPYLYTWKKKNSSGVWEVITGATTNRLSNIGAGEYAVNIEDGNGIIIGTYTNNTLTAANDVTYTLTQPNLLTVTLAKNDIRCHNANNGSITATIAGGTGSYTLLWSNGSNSQNLSNLSPGTYTITVEDDKGCRATASATITQPANPLQITYAAPVTPTYFGATNGSISATVTGGTPKSDGTYDFEWRNSAGTNLSSQAVTSVGSNQFQLTLNNIGEETYYLTIEDANYKGSGFNANCTIVDSDFFLDDPDPLLVSIDDIQPIPCNSADGSGTSTGTLFANVSGGVQIPGFGYQYEWFVLSGGNYVDMPQVGSTVADLAEGTYRVRVTDNSSIQAETTFVFEQPEALVITYSKQDVLCRGSAIGSIDVSVTGGSGFYAYEWSNSSGTVISDNQDINALIADTYQIEVTDSQGCSTTQSMVINEPSSNVAITLDGIVNPIAYQASDGSISVSVSGGTGAYTYEWTNALGTLVGTSQDINGLPDGTYTLTVKDGNFTAASGDGGCATSQVFVVTEPDVLVAAITVQNEISCFGDSNGALSASTSSGGILPYAYEWFSVDGSGVATALGVTTETLANRAIGTYRLQITDANLISTTTDFELNQPLLLRMEGVAVTDVLCFGEATGAIDITLSGGTAPYTFFWSNGATTEDASGIPSGTYTVTITDANNCELVQSGITVIQPDAPLAIDSALVTDLTGFETDDGAIGISISGGTGSYGYSWVEIGQTTVLSTTNEVSNLAAGNYRVTITDGHSCELVQDYEVTQPDLLVVSIDQPFFNLCFNDTAATIRANATGGVPPYQYMWYSTADPAIILGNAMNFENIMAGSYGVAITDANGIQTSDTITITQPDPLAVTATTVDILCFSDLTGAIDITVTGGTGVYTYLWSNGAATEDINGLSDGEYTVTVTDQNNCSITETYTLIQPTEGLRVNDAILTQPLGFGLSNGSIRINIAGGTPGYSYAWYDGANAVLPETSPTLSGIAAGEYSVLITDANACTLIQDFTLDQPDLLEVEITSIPINCFGETGTLIANVAGGFVAPGETYQYQWSDGTVAIGDMETLPDVLSGSYQVLITDSNGITTQGSFELTQPDLLEITTIETVDVICYGEPMGTIDITVAGGTGSYTYQWNNGAVTEDLANLYSGEYTVTVLDENNCTVSQTITITQPELYDIANVSLTRPSDSNSDGEIGIALTGGDPPFSYQWMDEGGSVLAETSTSSRSNTLGNLVAGTYTITITDSLGCIHQDTYNLADPGELLADIEQLQAVTCFNGSDAQLRVNTIGGVGGNRYTWYNADTNATVGTDSELLTAIPTGSYYVVVANAEGLQEQSAVFTVGQPEVVAATALGENVSCHSGTDGTIGLQASGGNGSYEYRVRLNSGLYSDWVGFANGNTTVVQSLISGNYQVQVRDTNSCNFEINGAIQTISIEIQQPEVLEITSYTINDATGFGLYNGTLSVSVAGGTLPYTYSWEDSNGTPQASTTERLSNLPEGTYTVTIIDAQQCVTSGTYVVNQPDLLEVSINTQSIVLCNGDDNGSLTALAEGGIGFETGPAYLYSWFAVGNTNPIGNEAAIYGLGVGTYYVVVEDANGNVTQSADYEVIQPEPLQALTNGDYERCGTGNDWTIGVTVQGGTPPYSYSWNTGDNTPTLENMLPGSYLVIIKDANGCELMKTFGANPPEELHVVASIDQPLCADSCEGSIALNITGGIAPYAIAWDTGATAASIESLCPGNYLARVTDQLGCGFVVDVSLENPETVAIDLGEDRTLCIGQSLELDISSNDADATYFWESDNGFLSTSPNVSLTQAGTYTATLTTGLGCVGMDTIEVLESQAGINAQFLVTSQAFAEENVILINTSNPMGENVQWLLPTEAEIIEQTNETLTLYFELPGAYEITLRSIEGNCFQDYTKPIVVEEARELPDIGDAASPFIIDFTTYPNPTSGQFSVAISLQEEAMISARLYSLTSNLPLDDRQESGAKEYVLEYDMQLPSGIYFVSLETAKAREIRKIIIE